MQLLYGRRVRRDPWQATTLEWAMPLPPPPYNFASVPHFESRDDRVAPATLAPALARGDGYLGFTRNGWQETLGVHVTSGAPDQLIVLPRATYLPLWTALATAGVVLAFLFKLYWLALAAATRGRGPLRVGRAERGTARATTARCRSAVA